MSALSPRHGWLPLLLAAALPLQGASFFAPGDVVRVAKGEMLEFQGKKLAAAPKGQEFTVLQMQALQNVAFVGYYKEDGSLIAATIPANALEAAPPDAWRSLLRGAEAFQGMRLEDARRFITIAAQEPRYRTVASTLNSRVTGLIAAYAQGAAGRPALGGLLVGLRETAADLAKEGYLCLALPLDEGVDRALAQAFGAQPIPPAFATKLDRAGVAQKVATSQRCVARARQAISLRRLVEGKKYIDEGLAAEPDRPELNKFERDIRKALTEAEETAERAEKMRQIPKGTPHALTAMERGLKDCADHPKLLALKKEMSGEFEARTAPVVTPAMLTASRTSTALAQIEEGRKLYTNRCAECHDLELLDSRSPTGWDKAVSGMAGRAKLSEPEKARIMEYITVAWNSLDAEGAR